MKIVSKRGQAKEVDIELDLPELDEFDEAVNADADPSQIQLDLLEIDAFGAACWANRRQTENELRQLDCVLTYNPRQELWTVLHGGTVILMFTQEALQSGPEQVAARCRFIIERRRVHEATNKRY